MHAEAVLTVVSHAMAAALCVAMGWWRAWPDKRLPCRHTLRLFSRRLRFLLLSVLPWSVAATVFEDMFLSVGKVRTYMQVDGELRLVSESVDQSVLHAAGIVVVLLIANSLAGFYLAGLARSVRSRVDW